MESWNTVINAALLGTEKRSLQPGDLDPALAEWLAIIDQGQTDKEETFLQIASTVYNYRQAGFQPLHQESLAIAPAETEEKNYASAAAHTVLKDILEVGGNSLLQLWLETCIRSEKIVQPEMLPVLLNAGIKQQAQRAAIDSCIGKRGAWLQALNEAWRWNKSLPQEEVWETGSLADRKKLLAEMRAQDPAQARAMLQSCWSRENANAREELLDQLRIQAGPDDLPWLESLLKDRSVRVKNLALTLIKSIPESSLLQQYWSILQASIRFVSSKGLLGIGTKTSLEVKLVPVDEQLFQTGIEAVSSVKNTTDEDWILYQLVAAVPPHWWEAYLHQDPKSIVELFLKHKATQALVPALGMAATTFENIEWLRVLSAAQPRSMYVSLFSLLPHAEAERYALRFMDTDDGAASVLPRLAQFKQEWSVDFALAVLRYASQKPYEYQKNFYDMIAAMLPPGIVYGLESFGPKEHYVQSLWSNHSDYIVKLITLKQQTLKAF